MDRYNILMVESDDSTIEKVRRMFRTEVKTGTMKIRVARNVKKATAMIRGHKKWNLILLDSRLDGSTDTDNTHGLIVLAMLHQQQARIVSTSHDPKSREMAMIIGCHGETDKHEIQKIVRDWVRKYRRFKRRERLRQRKAK